MHAHVLEYDPMKSQWIDSCLVSGVTLVAYCKADKYGDLAPLLGGILISHGMKNVSLRMVLILKNNWYIAFVIRITRLLWFLSFYEPWKFYFTGELTNIKNEL